MKLTSKGRYAVMAMADLAKNYVKETNQSYRNFIAARNINILFRTTFFKTKKK